MKIGKRKSIILAAAVLAIAVCLIFLAVSMDKEGAIKGEGSSPTRDMNAPDYFHIKYKNKSYAFNSDLKTILFIGVDNMGEVKSSEVYLNDGQADFLMLAVVDEAQRNYSLLHINRDTMTEVQLLGLQGKVAGHDVMQIALSHTYGTGLEDSCDNTVKAVSDLLSGIGIDYYISMNMDGVAALNDSIGGVDVEVLDDFDNIPEFKKGEVVHLSGELALSYVRGRMSTETGTNTSRMQRQRQYIDAFLQKYNETDSASAVVSVINEISDYTVTNMSAAKLSDFASLISDYEFKGIDTIEGDVKLGETYIEFYPDEKALEKQVVETFYVRD